MLDVNYGVGVIFGVCFFELFGCKVVMFGEEFNGWFVYFFEFIVDNLVFVGNKVVEL